MWKIWRVCYIPKDIYAEIKMSSFLYIYLLTSKKLRLGYFLSRPRAYNFQFSCLSIPSQYMNKYDFSLNIIQNYYLHVEETERKTHCRCYSSSTWLKKLHPSTCVKTLSMQVAPNHELISNVPIHVKLTYSITTKIPTRLYVFIITHIHAHETEKPIKRTFESRLFHTYTYRTWN